MPATLHKKVNAMNKKNRFLKRIARALEKQNGIDMASIAVMCLNHQQSHEVEQQLLALAKLQQQPDAQTPPETVTQREEQA